MDKQIFTIQKAAAYLGVSPDTLRRWETRGTLIPLRTAGNQRRYTKNQLDGCKGQKHKKSVSMYDENTIDHSFEKALPISLPKAQETREQLYPVGLPSLPVGMTFHDSLPLAVNDLSEVDVAEEESLYRNFRHKRPLLIGFAAFILGILGLLPLSLHLLGVRSGLLSQTSFFGATHNTNINNTRAGVLSSVLGANTRTPNYLFSVGIPGAFTSTLDVKEKLTIHSSLDTSNTDINAGSGRLTASNVIYGLVAGNGIKIGSGQTPTISANGVNSLSGQTGALSLAADTGLSLASGSGTITFRNTDTGSAQKIFSTIAVQGGSSITAGSNTDTLTFIPGAGVTLSASGKSLTITSTAAASSWSLTGNDIYFNSGNVGIGTTAPSSLFDVGGNFKVNGAGDIIAGTFQGTAISTQYGGTGQNFSAIAQGSVLYFSSTGTLAALSPTGASGYVLESQGDNANPHWVNIGSALSQYWYLSSLGTISPVNNSVDFLIGDSATTSAKFGLINVNSGTPTATISGTTSSVYLTGDGNLATTNNHSLTLGGITTGNILLNPGNGTGSVTIDGLVNLTGTNYYEITGNSVLSSTDLGVGVVNSSLTKVGALTSGSIAPNFGTIVTNRLVSGSDLAATGNGGGLTFSGSGTHTVSASSGTLTINAYTLGGNVTGNNRQISGLGNIGIGTTSPLAEIDVTGNASTSGNITFRTNTTHSLNLLDNSAFSIQRSAGGDTGLTAILTIDRGGNVGIGTTNAGMKLAVNGALGLTGASSFYQTLTSNAAAAKTYNLPDFAGPSADICLTTGNCSGAGGGITGAGTTNYVAKFSTSSTLGSGTIYDNGNVGLATTSPKALLDVNGTASVSGQLALYGTPTIQSTDFQTLILGGNTTGNILLTPGNGSGSVTITGLGTGPVHSAGGLLSTSSINLASEVTGTLPVANGGTGATTLLANGLLVGNGTSSVGLTAAGTNGQLLLGVTSGAPTFATLSGDATITNAGVITLKNTGPGAGSLGTTASQTPIITIDAQGRVVSVVNTNISIAASQIISGILPIARGGTNNGTAYTAGSIIYADGSKLAEDNANLFYNSTTHSLGLGTTSPTAVLDVNGTASVSGQLALYGTPVIQSTANQALVLGGSTTGNIVLKPRNGAGSVQFTGYTTGLVHSNGTGILTSSLVDLVNDVTGNLGIANGGTGLNAFGGPNQLLGVNAGHTAVEYKDLSSLLVAGAGIGLSGTTTVTVSNTGVTSLTGMANQIVVSGGTGPVTLSTPQDIATSSTVQFGKLGLGIAPTTNLHIGGQTTGKALAILNYMGSDQNILTASASGTTQFNLSNTGTIAFTGGSSFLQTLTSNASAAKTFNLPNFSGPSVDICLSTGNCQGAGSSITGSGTTNYISKFSANQNIVSSNLYSDTNGNLGIGTTIPTSLFHLAGTNTGKALAIFNDTGSDQNIFTASASGATKFNITHSGNIGFTGNSSFMNTLTSLASADTTYVLPDPGKPSTNICLDSGNCAGLGGVVSGTGTANYIPIWSSTTGISSSVLYQSGGNVGLGTTTPTAKLDVNGTASVSGKLTLYGTPQIESTVNQTLTLGGATTGNIRFIPQGTNTLTLSNGNITAFGTLSGVTDFSASGTITLSGISNGVLRATSGVISSGQVDLSQSTDVTNLLGINHGGTGVGNLVTGGMLYGNGGASNAMTKLLPGNAGQVLTMAGGVPAWTDASGLSSSYWTITSGALQPGNTTVDLLVGGSSSSSAKFAFINVNSGTPTASIAGNLTLNSVGIIATTNKQGLTIGDTNTGNIILNGGNIGIGTTAPAQSLDVVGNIKASGNYYVGGAQVLSSTTLGATVVNVGALTGGSIASGFGAIATGNTITGTVLNGTTGVYTGAGAGTQRIDTSGNLLNIGTIAATQFSTATGVVNLASGVALQINGTTVIDASRNLANIGTTQLNGLTYTWPGSQSVGAFLQTNGTGGLSWTDLASATGNYWRQSNGAVYPANSTVDLLIGGTSSASAKFAFINVNSGTPTASIAGNLILNSAGVIATTNKQGLTIGDTNTGNIVFNGGNVGIGTTAPGQKLDIVGNLSLSGSVTAGTWSGTAISSTYGGTGIDSHLMTGVPTLSSGVWSVASQLSTLRGGTGQDFSAIAQGSVPYFSFPTGTMAALAAGTPGYILTTNGGGANPSWSDPATLAGGTNLWQLQGSAIAAKNSTEDLLLGGQATSSAKFAFINVNSGSPTASISGNLALVSPTTVNSPANLLNLYNNGSFSIQNSIGGDSGLASSFFVSSKGNVGIGTTAPVGKLTLSNNVLTGNIDAYSKYQEILYNSGTAAGSYGIGIEGNTMDFNSGAGAYKFYRGGSTVAMMVDTSGNVGIGTAAPGAIQENELRSGLSSVSPQTQLRFQGGQDGSSWGMQWNANVAKIDINTSRLTFAGGNNSSGSYAPADVLSLTTAGNVGIGTTGPTAMLHVVGATAATGTNAINTLTVVGGTGGGGSTGSVSGGIGGDISLTAGTGGGTCGIAGCGGPGDGGTLSLTGGTGGFSTGGGGGGGNVNITGGTGGGAGGSHGYVLLQPTSGNVGIGTQTPGAPLAVTVSGANPVSTFTNGNGTCTINPTAGSTNCSSDARLKNNVSTITPAHALDQVLALRGVTFNWIADGGSSGDHVGFIAQEVQKVVPELVSTDSATGYLQVGYSNFAPILVNAMQQLNAKVDDQGQIVSTVQSQASVNEQTLASLPSTYASASAVLGVQTQLDSHAHQIATLTGQVSQLTDLVNLLASSSASFNASGSASFASADILNIKDATISGTLNVLGRTTLGDLGVTGNIQAGLMTIKGLDESGNASINTVGDLYLQNTGTGGINLFAGKMTIDNGGNLTTTGRITAKKLNLDESDVLSASVGTAIIKAGQSSISVTTSSLTPKSHIFVTPTTPAEVGAAPIGIDTFRISIPLPLTQDLKVSWWIVN